MSIWIKADMGRRPIYVSFLLTRTFKKEALGEVLSEGFLHRQD
jgi:hypothetical protein